MRKDEVKASVVQPCQFCAILQMEVLRVNFSSYHTKVITRHQSLEHMCHKLVTNTQNSNSRTVRLADLKPFCVF